MKIIIGADIVATSSNFSNFADGTMENIVDSRILDLLEKAEYRRFNLEAPLTDDISPIEKAGPALACPTAAIKGIN